MRKTAFIIFLIYAFPCYVMAGSFKVVPVIVSFDASSKTAVVRITNDGAEKLTVEVKPFAWSQNDDGPDRYEPTEELVVFPKLLTVDPGQEKSLRLGHQFNAPAAIERAYRIYLEELPVRKPGELAVKMALRIGVPVFIKPAKETMAAELEKIWFDRSAVKWRIINKGSSHFVPSEMKLAGMDAAGNTAFIKEVSGWYILSGRNKTYQETMTRDECLKVTAVEAAFKAGKTAYRKRLPVETAWCEALPAAMEIPKGDESPPPLP